MGKRYLIQNNEKGAILIELVISCLVLVIFFYACVGSVFLVRDKLYLQRIARDGAREAVMVESKSAGIDKARDRAQQFFGSESSNVSIDLTIRGEGPSRTVVCKVSYPHNLFGNIFDESMGGVNLSATAVFGWKDFS